MGSPVLRHQVATHMHDLTVLALELPRSRRQLAGNRGMGAARLKAAKTYIAENLQHRDISIGTVAAHLGMTPRHLQRLFENDGTTFSAFLLGRRLARAYRMLCEPRSGKSRSARSPTTLALAIFPISTAAFDGSTAHTHGCQSRRFEIAPGRHRMASGAAALHCYCTGAWISLRRYPAHPPINTSANHD